MNRGRSHLAPLAIPLVLLLLASCAGESGSESEIAMREASPEAQALDGRPLFRPELSPELQAQREAQLSEARAAWEADPDDVDAIIWFGRRTAYLGRYRDAVEIYSTGLERHPDEHRLLRHRGHRYLSLRRLDDAIVDLERAASLIADLPDEVEPDGLPNARNMPTSSSHSNIWYHLGLAYYLKGDFDNAARCYRECMKFSNNPDMLCATSHWLYMTLRRGGRAEEAQQLLEPIHAEMDVIENGSYHRLLLMYKGELSPEDLLPDGDTVDSATVGYGVASWHRVTGDEARATELLERVVAGSQWAAFGYIAAEADLAR